MDEISWRLEENGFFTRGDARDTGYDDRAVTAMTRSGEWHRIRRGYYTSGPAWARMDPVARHRVRSHAVLHSLGPGVALSHVSGAIEHGIDTWGVPLDRVHVTRLDGGAGRTEPDVVHHEGLCLGDDVVEVGGRRVLLPERCALEAGSRATSEAALVHLDSLLHHRLADADALFRRFAAMARWPFMQHLHIPVRMADARSESVGETRGKWLCHVHRLPAPVLQYPVYDANGVLRGTCDWGWPEYRCLGEFDGRCKYGRLLRPGQDPGEVMFAEKEREDLLRRITDCSMVRLTWDDYSRPRLTAHRIRQKLGLAR